MKYVIYFIVKIGLALLLLFSVVVGLLPLGAYVALWWFVPKTFWWVFLVTVSTVLFLCLQAFWILCVLLFWDEDP